MTNESTFPTPDFWLKHHVSYGETDAMGVVYYGQYLHFFERSRSNYTRELGMSYAEIERRGLILPVREAHCRYRASARYDDLIWIRCAIGEWSRASMTFVYEIYDEPREKILATGYTQHACVDHDLKLTRFPQWFLDYFKKD